MVESSPGGGAIAGDARSSDTGGRPATHRVRRRPSPHSWGRSVGRRDQPARLMASIDTRISSRTSGEIGAEPADAPEAAWPASEPTYVMNALTRSSSFWSSYCRQTMWYETSAIGYVSAES